MNAIRRARIIGFAAIVAAAGMPMLTTLTDAPAAHAAAASQPVQFSDDGIHWSDSYAGALFGGLLLVPGGSSDRAFYVRNGSGEPAVLSVTLFDVTTTDTDLAGAMSLASSMPGRPGASVPVTSARPCATLSQGKLLAAGDGTRIDNVASLADLNGTAGQAQSVSFKLAVTLSSTDSAAPAPNTCPSSSGTVVVIGAPSTPAAGSTHPVYHLGADGWTPKPAAASNPAPVPVTAPTASAAPDGQASPALRSLAANTQRLYQENVVVFWLAMAVLGVLVLLFVRRRRSADDDDPSQQHPFTPTTQIGTTP